MFIDCFTHFFYLYKEYNNCLISFLCFSELSPVSNGAKEIGSLLSICCGVKILSPCPS